MQRKVLISICITLVCLSISTTKAVIVYDDGGTYDYTTDTRYSDMEVFKNSSGVPTTVNLLTGGIIDFLRVDGSQVNIAGGEVFEGIWATGNSYLNISSGTVRADESFGVCANDSYVVITGGNIIEEDSTGLQIGGNSTVEIHGSNFMINFISVGYGEITQNSGFLTGTLKNGDSLAIQFGKTDADSIILIPEPTTMLMLGLGTLALRIRRKTVG